jgi:hypothetical protein
MERVFLHALLASFEHGVLVHSQLFPPTCICPLWRCKGLQSFSSCLPLNNRPRFLRRCRVESRLRSTHALLHHSRAPFCRVVEQDLQEILHEAWAAIVPENDTQEIDHDGIAAQTIDAADAQDTAALEAAFIRVQSTYDDHTLGEITDRVLIYTVQKGWAGACKVCTPASCPLQWVSLR